MSDPLDVICHAASTFIQTLEGGAAINIPDNQIPLIQAASDAHRYPFNLLASQGYCESGLDPACKSGNTDASLDRGWAQINNIAHPEVSDAQAYDLEFAVNWMAQEMASLDGQYASWELALLAYNGGAGAVIAYNDGKPYNLDYATKIIALAQFSDIWPKCQQIITLCGELYGLAFSQEEKTFWHGTASAVRGKMGWPME